MKIPKNPNVVEKFICPTCETLHGDKWEADDCCPQKIESVFECSICKETFEDEDEVVEHIADEHDVQERDAFGLPVVTKAELEAAGQVRLFA